MNGGPSLPRKLKPQKVIRFQKKQKQKMKNTHTENDTFPRSKITTL